MMCRVVTRLDDARSNKQVGMVVRRIFSGRATGDFSKIFLRGPNVVKFVFPTRN